MKQFDLIGSDINKSATTVEHKAIKCSFWERAATIKDIMQVCMDCQMFRDLENT